MFEEFSNDTHWRPIQNSRAPQRWMGNQNANNNNQLINDPALGRRRLSGAGNKWYLRYLKDGFEPEEAYRKALERRPVPNVSQNADRKRSNYSRPITSIPKRLHTVREEEPVEGERKSNTRDRDLEDKEKLVAIVPVGYPKETLSPKDLIKVEEAVLLEVASDPDDSLSLDRLEFKSGYMLVDCPDKKTAKWLLNVVAKLSIWNGKPLEAKLGGSVLPDRNVTLYIPNSATKDQEFIMALLRNQNSLCTDTWKVLSFTKVGDDCVLVLRIDNMSMQKINENGNKVWFRFGTIPVNEVVDLTEVDEKDDKPSEEST
ncbi:uncharacterized protein LOC115625777 [Scaptodrosophila lebanonensis]|uniref:Uncharacterized protein LOC115625777 n=1 Tax=Drosophila lebanonensis TaxID=7225 RepID=A0A6J2TJG7_DROLE|nr:uncharacterized protein LOC115625777 [Scaptodrosophila lebanonensis]XP_030376807.1 uncharacterized protein LOC115625777 [Scaptodrosophila lebanonensis]